jgi:hypothetical protein
MITINIDKAKTIAHDKRREARSVEFQPYDDAIAKQIPGQIGRRRRSKSRNSGPSTPRCKQQLMRQQQWMPQGETP